MKSYCCCCVALSILPFLTFCCRFNRDYFGSLRAVGVSSLLVRAKMADVVVASGITSATPQNGIGYM